MARRTPSRADCALLAWQSVRPARAPTPPGASRWASGRRRRPAKLTAAPLVLLPPWPRSCSPGRTDPRDVALGVNSRCGGRFTAPRSGSLTSAWRRGQHPGRRSDRDRHVPVADDAACHAGDEAGRHVGHRRGLPSRRWLACCWRGAALVWRRTRPALFVRAGSCCCGAEHHAYGRGSAALPDGGHTALAALGGGSPRRDARGARAARRTAACWRSVHGRSARCRSHP